MKLLFVIDSITDLNKKINMLKAKFGNDILFLVKSNLITLVKTYGINPNAVFKNNFTSVIHTLLAYNLDKDVVICYASVNIDNNLLNQFTNKIGNKQKVVNVMPSYNAYEKICNNVYNIYVKGLFKLKDSMISPKLQFIPKDFVIELISSHFGNRLFLFDERISTTLYIDKGELSNSLKTKTNFGKWHLIPIIAALIISIGLVLCLAFVKVNYLTILIFTFLYILDVVIAIIFHCKTKFDKRFMQ